MGTGPLQNRTLSNHRFGEERIRIVTTPTFTPPAYAVEAALHNYLSENRVPLKAAMSAAITAFLTAMVEKGDAQWARSEPGVPPTLILRDSKEGGAT
jgi:hypothetical protein